MDILHQILDKGPDVLLALLAVIGGLKVIARYTPFEWDDHALELAEKPLQFLASFLKGNK